MKKEIINCYYWLDREIGRCFIGDVVDDLGDPDAIVSAWMSCMVWFLLIVIILTCPVWLPIYGTHKLCVYIGQRCQKTPEVQTLEFETI